MAHARDTRGTGEAMAGGPEWQANYADLCDDRYVRFGAECAVCHARYMTVPVPLVAPIPADYDPDPATVQALDEQKYELFHEFDAAFRNITIHCFRCGQPACPDCWDVDKQMCGACVAERGLIRSPHRGAPGDGPLADGYLRRAEPGRYSEVARPTWLKELLLAQSDPDAARAAHLTAPPLANAPSVAPQSPGALPDLDLAASYPRAPTLRFDRPSFEPPPTAKMEANAMAAGTPDVAADGFNGPEGEATSGMVECPRCGAANYDFVTQCSGCGLQLIQVCPTCEKLNPGHVEQCQHCHARLNRPFGWSGVVNPIVALQPEVARKRMTAQPAIAPTRPAPPPPPPPQSQQAPVWYGEPPASAPPARVAWERRPPLTPPPAAFHVPAEPVLAPTFMGAGVGVGMSADGRHPYETAGPALQPVLPYAVPPVSSGARVVTLVATVVERLFTVALVVALFVVVGSIAAAEASPPANHFLSQLLHFDIKSHVDALLAMLHLHLPR